MQTILDELMQESLPAANCHGGQCKCYNCSHQQEQNEILQELRQLNLNLETEEEYELSTVISRAKDLLKKGYNKTKPFIVAGDIIRRLITSHIDPALPPQPPPNIVDADTARFYEEEKKRRHEAMMEQARQARKRNMTQRPDKETSLMQELLTEQEYTTG